MQYYYSNRYSTAIDNSISTNYNNIGNDKNLLDVSTIKQLQINTQFNELRFECYKPSVGRRINIATKDNAEGHAVINLLIFQNISEAQACNSYKRMQNDNSLLTANCSMWGVDGKWGVQVLTTKQLYEAPFYWYDRYMLGSTTYNSQ